MEISVRELKNRLSEYLRRLQAGWAFTITSHGRPVGRLTPAPPAPQDPEAEGIARLRAQAWVRPDDGETIGVSADPIKLAPGERPLSDILLEDRE